MQNIMIDDKTVFTEQAGNRKNPVNSSELLFSQILYNLNDMLKENIKNGNRSEFKHEFRSFISTLEDMYRRS